MHVVEDVALGAAWRIASVNTLPPLADKPRWDLDRTGQCPHNVLNK